MPNHSLPVHPQHRLVILLLLAVLLPLSAPLLVGLVHLVLLLLCFRVETLGDWWRTVLRLKWLMISLFVLYGWFTPGLPLWEVAGVNMPTRAGLMQAAYRALLLSALVATVMWLVKPLSANVLAVSLARVLGLMKRIGVDTDSLVRRLALSMHTVVGLQQELSQRKNQGWLAAAGGAMLAAEQGELPSQQQIDETSAETASDGKAVLPFPSLRQYLNVVGLVALMLLVYGLSISSFIGILPGAQ